MFPLVWTHLVLFYCLQIFMQSNCTRRSAHRKQRKCKTMFSDHLCYFQSNLLAQMGKYVAILAVVEHPCYLVREAISHGQVRAGSPRVLWSIIHPREWVLLCFTYLNICCKKIFWFLFISGRILGSWQQLAWLCSMWLWHWWIPE